MSLPKKYRPRRFADVVGQDLTVRYLSKLITRGQIGEHLLFYGSVGSGKTTLARLYAKALNCRNPDPNDGSPCDACDRCDAFEDIWRTSFREIDSPNLPTGEAFREFVESVAKPPGGDDKWRVLFFDEVQALPSRRDFPALLKRIEDAPSTVIYCFATTDIDQIPEAILSRFIQFEIKPLQAAKAIEYLGGIAAEEGIAANSEGLALLCALGRLQPRDMLQYLDGLRVFGVSRDTVRDRFGLDGPTWLILYFQALADGNMAELTRVWLEWNERAEEKLRLILLFLLSIYYVDLLHLDVVVDPIVASIRPYEREPILRAVRSRVEGVGRNLNTYWMSLIDFWSHVSHDYDEALTNLRFALFHELVCQNQTATSEAAKKPVMIDDLQSQNGQMEANQRPSVSRPPKRVVRVNDPEYLSYEDVRVFFNTASISAQAYRLYFNVRITFWSEAFGATTEKASTNLISQFAKELATWVRTKSKGPCCRCTVLESDNVRGHCSRTIVHVPDQLLVAFDSWIRGWNRKERQGPFSDDVIKIEKPKYSATSQRRRMNYHYQSVRWLCGGVYKWEDDYDLSGQLKPLAELLGIEKHFLKSAGNIGKHRRQTFSDELLPGTITELSEYGMGFLSPFDDRAWDRLYDGWEFDEHESRKEGKAKHLDELAVLRAQYASDPVKLRVEEEFLFRRWEDPRDRPRKWRTWWGSPVV